MRRLLSISAVIALLASLAPAHMLMSCHAASVAHAVCHRTGAAAHVHHCEMMEEEQDATNQDATYEESGSTVASLNTPYTCPMNCCFRAGSSVGAAIATGPADFQLPRVEYSFSSIQIVFARTGFSSHTDRGPPVA